MKSLIIVLIGIFSITTAFAQHVLNLSNNIDTELPEKAVKITEAEAKQFVANQFNSNQTALTFISGSAEIYKLDGIIILLNTSGKAVKSGRLLALKNGLEAIYRDDPSYSSSIKKIGENDLLITNNTSGNIGKCGFFSYSANNRYAITGNILFNQPDSLKAAAVLDYIARHLKFSIN